MDRFDTIGSYHVEHSRRTRLGGEIASIAAGDGGRFFVKKGGGFERRELIRERRMLERLQGLHIAPAMREFHDSGDHAVLVTEAAAGIPLHEAASGNADLAERVLVDVFRRFDAIAPDVYRDLPAAVDEEIADIEEIIAGPLFNEARFRDSVGQDPRECLQRVKREVALHAQDMLSHGDLCLPNIIVSDAGAWCLLDWGKSGCGNKARDLMALRHSLPRNELGQVWTAILRQEGGGVSEAELDTYRLLDFFWYATS